MTFKEELLLRLLPLYVPPSSGSLTGDSKATQFMRDDFIKKAREHAARMLLFAEICDEVVHPPPSAPESQGGAR